MSRGLARGLRARGIDVVTTLDAGRDQRRHAHAADPGAANGVYETFDQGDTIRRISTLVINGNGVDAVSYGGVGNAELLVIGNSDRLFMRTAAHPAPLTQVLTFPGTGFVPARTS